MIRLAVFSIVLWASCFFYGIVFGLSGGPLELECDKQYDADSCLSSAYINSCTCCEYPSGYSECQHDADQCAQFNNATEGIIDKNSVNYKIHISGLVALHLMYIVPTIWMLYGLLSYYYTVNRTVHPRYQNRAVHSTIVEMPCYDCTPIIPIALTEKTTF